MYSIKRALILNLGSVGDNRYLNPWLCIRPSSNSGKQDLCPNGYNNIYPRFEIRDNSRPRQYKYSL